MISQLARFRCKPRADNAAPVVGRNHESLIFLQVQLPHTDNELGNRLQDFKRAICWQAVRTSIPGKVDGDEDIVPQKLWGLENMTPEEERVRET